MFCAMCDEKESVLEVAIVVTLFWYPSGLEGSGTCKKVLVTSGDMVIVGKWLQRYHRVEI